MAATGPVTVSFGNLVSSMGFQFTYSAGVRPSTCYVDVPSFGDGGDPSWVSDLVIKFGSAELRFRDCILDEPQLRTDPMNGKVWSLPIKDRRWKWGYGHVYGHYNWRKANGSKRNPRNIIELLTMCAEAFGEQGIVLNLPPGLDQHFPEVNWTGQNAAQEMERLALEIECAVTLNPFTNHLEVNRLDQTSRVGGATAGWGITQIEAVRPSRFVAEAGPTMFEAFWSLEPVGLDVDGLWKPIDKLSFKRGPWTIGEALGGFHKYTSLDVYNDIHSGQECELRDLAASHVYRSFRLTGSVNLLDNGHGARIIPDNVNWLPGQKPRTWDDIKLLPRLAKEGEDAEGALFVKPPQAFGSFFRRYHGMVENSYYPFGFSFDTEHRVVTFGEVMWKLPAVEGEQLLPANIFIICAFHAGAEQNWHRYRTNSISNLSPTTGLMVLQHPEIYLTITDFGEQNQAEVDKALHYYLDGYKKKYLSRSAGTWNLPGLHYHYADGSIQQVTWSGGNKAPCMTFVSRGQRHERYKPTLEQYALEHKLQSAIKMVHDNNQAPAGLNKWK